MMNEKIDSGLLEIDVLMTKAVLDYVNTWEGKSARIYLDIFDKEPPAMMLQQQGGSYKLKQYIDGSFVGQYPFIVYTRIDGSDTHMRLEATKLLENLHLWFKNNEINKTLPDLGINKKYQKIEMTSAPSIAVQYDNGYEDYSATFILTYEFRNN